jgi:hypothetical protein
MRSRRSHSAAAPVQHCRTAATGGGLTRRCWCSTVAACNRHATRYSLAPATPSPPPHSRRCIGCTRTGSSGAPAHRVGPKGTPKVLPRYSQGTPKERRRTCASSWRGVSFCIISITAVILCTPPPSCRALMNDRRCRAGGWSGRLAHRAGGYCGTVALSRGTEQCTHALLTAAGY